MITFWGLSGSSRADFRVVHPQPLLRNGHTGRSGGASGSLARYLTPCNAYRSQRQAGEKVGGGDGQSVREGLEVHDGVVLVEGGRTGRPEGTDPAGHRRRPAAAP